MDKKEYEKLVNQYDKDGEIRELIKSGVKKIERKYALFHFLLALVGILVAVGLTIFLWKLNIPFGYVIVPVGLVVYLFSLLSSSFKRITNGEPDEVSRKIVSKITKDS